MPQNTTRRRRSTSGRQRNSGPSNYPSSRSKPNAHPIIPARTSDQISSSRPTAKAPEADPKLEQQEMLQMLEDSSSAPDQFQPKDDVIGKYVEEDLGLRDPDSQPEPASTTATSFSPTIGRPDRASSDRSSRTSSQGKDSSPSSDSRSNSSSSSNSSDGNQTEKQKLSDIMNQEKASLQKDLQSKSDKLKSQKISGWNFRGKIKSRLKRVILGMAIAALVAVPIAALGIIPHAVQSWIANRTSVYVERAADKMGQKLLFAFFRDRVAVGKCKSYYSIAANVDPTQASCRPRLDEKDGRLAQLFNDWRSAKMEEKLFNKGINVEYDPGESPDKPYKITIEGEDFRAAENFGSPDWDVSRFVGKREGSNILRRQMKSVLKEDTRWWQYMKRRNMKAGYLRDLNLPKRFFGSDEFAKKRDEAQIKRNKKFSRWRQYLTKHVVNIGKGRVAFLIEILFEGNSAKANDKKSIIDNNITLRRLANRIGDDEVIRLLEKFAGKNLKQISKQVVLDLVEKIFGKVVRKSAESASKAIPVVGWILLAFTVFDLLDMVTDGSMQKYISVQNAQSMMDMSNLMDTTISEERRGYVDADSAGDLRLSLIKGMASSRIFSNTVGYKSPKDKQAEGYNCKPNVSVTDINSVLQAGGEIFGGGDPNALPQTGMEDGQDVCKNHRVDYNPLEAFNMPAATIQRLLQPYTSQCILSQFIPLGGFIFDEIFDLFGCPTGTPQELYHKANNVIGWFTEKFGFLFNWIANLPLVKDLTQLGIGWLTNAITILITGNALAGAELLQGGLKTDTKSGARIFDSWSGGQQVVQNAFAKGVGDGGGLGLVAQTPTETSALNRSIAQERKEHLASASVFERMFDMSNSDTLASSFTGLAVSEGGFSNFVNPFSNLALAFNTGTSSAFAGNNDQEYCGDANQYGKAVTEFGVVCYAIADDLIDGMSEEDMVQYSDPEFCKQYTAELDAELAAKEALPYPSAQQDPDGSGQATKPNYCRLMCSVTDSMGTNFRSNDKICGFENFASGSSSGSSGSDGSGGGGSNNDPVEGALGKCEGVEVIRPNAGKPANDVEIQIVPGTTIDILAELCINVKNMVAAAAGVGLTLNGGGFRTYDEQVALRRSNCGTSQYAVYEMPAGSCSPPTARPGTSNHERGTAIDFGNCRIRDTPCYKWLNSNAATFGFKNLPSEPWHWSTNGK